MSLRKRVSRKVGKRSEAKLREHRREEGATGEAWEFRKAGAVG
jgi:hypothetical protein